MGCEVGCLVGRRVGCEDGWRVGCEEGCDVGCLLHYVKEIYHFTIRAKRQNSFAYFDFTWLVDQMAAKMVAKMAEM